MQCTFYHIDDLSEVEYENLVKDYETTKISINDLKISN